MTQRSVRELLSPATESTLVLGLAGSCAGSGIGSGPLDPVRFTTTGRSLLSVNAEGHQSNPTAGPNRAGVSNQAGVSNRAIGPSRADGSGRVDGAGQELASTIFTGGIANAGSVRRQSDTVRRPLTIQARAVHSYLRHLHEAGMWGIPHPIAITDDDEILSFIPGEAATDPVAQHVVSDQTLVDLARFQRDMHAASAGFSWPADVRPGLPYAPPGALGELVCHNDLNCQNVVFADGRLAGVIDFDYAAPVNPLFDIAVLARHWVPFRHPHDLDPQWQVVNQRQRFHLICDEHKLTHAQRTEVLDLALAYFDTVLEEVRLRAQADIGGFRAMWHAGYESGNRRARHWLAEQRLRLEARG